MRLGDILASMGLDPEAGITRQGPEAKAAFANFLRANQTDSERMMARVLYHLGCNVEAQVPIMGWIVDFYDAENRVVIEVDGDSHADKAEADALRDEKMRDAGLKVIRIEAWEVLPMMQQVAHMRRAA